MTAAPEMAAAVPWWRAEIAPALKDSAAAALIVFALSATILGMHLASGLGGVTLEFRWGTVGWAVGVAFVARLALNGWWRWRAARRVPAARNAVGERLDGAARVAFPAAVAAVALLALLLPWLPFVERYELDIAILVLTYIMLGWGLNIVVGLAGLLDLGYVAFYAVGAYSFALLSTEFGWTFWACLPLAGLLAATFGLVLGFPVLHLRGDYLAIVTLGFGEMIHIVLVNWRDVTNGAIGIAGLPKPTLFGLEFGRRASDGGDTFHTFFGLEYASVDKVIYLYYIILALAFATNLFTLRLRRLPVGRAWQALREDEIACRSLGINPTNTKLTAFAVGAMFGGFAGTFFAARQGFVSPESFTFIESAIILSIVVLGGMGSQTGVVIAALLLIGGTEFFRGFGEFRMLAFGAAMVLVMVWRPRGLMRRRKPTARLHADPG